MSLERDLLAIPMPASNRPDVYSGVARLAGSLWATRWQKTKRKPTTAVLIVHPTSNFLGHYALRPLAERGLAAVGFTTRYLGNDSALLMENCVLDVGAAIRHLREVEQYERVVLLGNSGGGGLAALYQQQAENPTITATPCGRPVSLVEAELAPADALILAMAHPGRAVVYTEWLDPAVKNEHDPYSRDTSLDMYAPENGPPYSSAFISRYRAGQKDRSQRITTWVWEQLAKLTEAAHQNDPAFGLVDDLPFLVHGTGADPRFLDLSLEASDRVATTLWGSPQLANMSPVTLGHYTSLRSWLSQWSIDNSRANAYQVLPDVSVPVQIVYGTADTAAFPSHAHSMYGAVTHNRRVLVKIKGADHYFRGQPELIEEMCDSVAEWVSQT